MGQKKKVIHRELKKHAATIHCSNTLSLLQRKISNALLYHAYNELMLKEEHEITVKQLCRLIGYQGNNHAAIKEALKGLITTLIEWNLLDDEEGAENWTASSIIASVSLTGPICYYAYSPRMKQLLHSPSMFGKIDLVIQSHFRSSYGLALYENCIRYRGLPHTKWFDMDMFKKLMGVLPGKYDVFRDFKRRVLDKAIDEVNTYSDLTISTEFLREGRKVIKIRFKLKERAKKIRLGSNPPPLPMDNHAFCKELINKIGLSVQQVSQLLQEYDQSYLEKKLVMIVESKPFKEKRIQNLPAYFFSALKNNYQLAKSIEINNNLQANIMDLELNTIRHHVEALRLNYNAYREEVIELALDALPKEEKEAFMTQFFTQVEPVIKTILHLQRNKYTRATILNSPQIKALLRQHALRELDCLSFISMDEFAYQQEEKIFEAWQKLKSLDPDHELLKLTE